jgi:Cytochrome c3
MNPMKTMFATLALALALAAPSAIAARAAKTPPRTDCAACHKEKAVLPAKHDPIVEGQEYSDCRACHKNKGEQSLLGKFPGSHKHLLAKVTCADCHGTQKPAAATYAPSAACLKCHGPYEKLIEKTAAVKPENPHDSPHWRDSLECYVCHRQHTVQTVNWCNNCHVFDVKVP